jgi:hypothetical protein
MLRHYLEMLEQKQLWKIWFLGKCCYSKSCLQDMLRHFKVILELKLFESSVEVLLRNVVGTKAALDKY